MNKVVNKKRDFNDFINAGKRIIAKIKKKTEDVIVPYSGDDGYYTDIEDTPQNDKDFEIVFDKSEKVDKADKRNIVKESKADTNFVELETEEEAEDREEAFNYYEKLVNGLEHIKSRSDENISQFSEKVEKFMTNNELLTRKEALTELDSLMVELEDKFGVLGDDIKKSNEDLTNKSKSNFENLSSSIDSMNLKAEQMIKDINLANEALISSGAKVDEIREATRSLNKLSDSFFEFKATSVEAKNLISDIQKKQKFMRIWSIAATSLIACVTIATLVFQILNYFY